MKYSDKGLSFDNKDQTNKDSSELSQKSNEEWWDSNPMGYNWSKKIKEKTGSLEYYNEIDKRFFFASNKFLPKNKIEFDKIINFDLLKDKNVLEIGVGLGSHASLLSKNSKSYTGIDITQNAISETKNRFKLFNLKGDLHVMDAESLTFADNSFDYIWSWGVVHHSASTEKIIKEVARVLKPGGSSCIMVYHRSFLFYYVIMSYLKGFQSGYIFKTLSPHKLVQKHTDGHYARYYTNNEWTDLVEKNTELEVEYIKNYGQHDDLIPIPAGVIKNIVSWIIPTFITRFINSNLKQGFFLVSKINKKL